MSSYIDPNSNETFPDDTSEVNGKNLHDKIAQEYKTRADRKYNQDVKDLFENYRKIDLQHIYKTKNKYGIHNRIKANKEQYESLPKDEQTQLRNKNLLRECVPIRIQKLQQEAELAYVKLLDVNNNITPLDYGQGVYDDMCTLNRYREQMKKSMKDMGISDQEYKDEEAMMLEFQKDQEIIDKIIEKGQNEVTPIEKLELLKKNMAKIKEQGDIIPDKHMSQMNAMSADFDRYEEIIENIRVKIEQIKEEQYDKKPNKDFKIAKPKSKAQEVKDPNEARKTVPKKGTKDIRKMSSTENPIMYVYQSQQRKERQVILQKQTDEKRARDKIEAQSKIEKHRKLKKDHEAREQLKETEEVKQMAGNTIFNKKGSRYEMIKVDKTTGDQIETKQIDPIQRKAVIMPGKQFQKDLQNKLRLIQKRNETQSNSLDNSFSDKEESDDKAQGREGSKLKDFNNFKDRKIHLKNLIRATRQTNSMDALKSELNSTNGCQVRVNLNEKEEAKPSPDIAKCGVLPPLAPKKTEAAAADGPKVAQAPLCGSAQNLTEGSIPIKNNRQFDDNVVLIRPTIDASDKELYQRNGFKTTGKSITSFLINGDAGVYARNVFTPTKLGQLTKDNYGIRKNMIKHSHAPFFNKRSLQRNNTEGTLSLQQTPISNTQNIKSNNSLEVSAMNLSRATKSSYSKTGGSKISVSLHEGGIKSCSQSPNTSINTDMSQVMSSGSPPKLKKPKTLMPIQEAYEGGATGRDEEPQGSHLEENKEPQDEENGDQVLGDDNEPHDHWKVIELNYGQQEKRRKEEIQKQNMFLHDLKRNQNKAKGAVVVSVIDEYKNPLKHKQMQDQILKECHNDPMYKKVNKLKTLETIDLSKQQMAIEKNNDMLMKRMCAAGVNELNQGQFARGRGKVMPVRELSEQMKIDIEIEKDDELKAAMRWQRAESNAQKVTTKPSGANKRAIEETKAKFRNQSMPLSEIEIELMKKYQGTIQYSRKHQLKKARMKERKDLINKIGMDAFKKLEYDGDYLKKRALIDQQLIVNGKRDFSYAQRKWNWYGEDGAGYFESTELQDWFNVWNQTQVKDYQSIRH